jgi:hypothetical protein
MMEQQALMRETLEEAYLYCGKLASACGLMSEYFQSGQTEEGIHLFSQFTKGLEWMLEALKLTGPMREQLEIAIDMENVPKVLQPLEEAWENRDFGLISDVLTYEIQPLFEEWRLQLAKITNAQ